MLQKGQKPDVKVGGDFEPVPADKYTTLIVDTNMIQQQKYQSIEMEDIMNYQFAILDDKPMPKKDGEKEEKTTRNRYLWKRCRLVLNKNSWLGKLAKAAVGRDLTKEEMESFDVESIVGKQVDVMVEQKESKDGQRIFNNILSFAKPVKELEPVEFEAKEEGAVEKSTVPAEAPKTKSEVDEFIDEIDAKKETSKPDDDVEVLELELKLARAKEAKAAKAKAKK